jgi:pantetheine-phosphate adenylyltransferase
VRAFFIEKFLSLGIVITRPMKKIAVFPGSFDPVTKGHESIVLRALSLFDEIIVAIGENSEKNSFFYLQTRIDFLEKVFKPYPEVSVHSYRGLTVDFCRSMNAKYILRGLRTSVDFEFERSIGQMNKKMYPDLETVFLLTLPEFTPLTSSIVRDIIRNSGDARQFVPDAITDELEKY